MHHLVRHPHPALCHAASLRRRSIPVWIPLPATNAQRALSLGVLELFFFSRVFFLPSSLFVVLGRVSTPDTSSALPWFHCSARQVRHSLWLLQQTANQVSSSSSCDCVCNSSLHRYSQESPPASKQSRLSAKPYLSRESRTTLPSRTPYQSQRVRAPAAKHLHS